MNSLDKQYQNLLHDIIQHGVIKQDRTGTGTLSVFGRQIRHRMSDGFPLLTTKKMAWKLIVTELLWFLRGDTNIKYLVDNGCNIWNGDAYQAYLKGGDVKWLKQIEVDTPIGKMNIPTPYTQEEFINKIKTDDEFANKWGDLGPVYGAQWKRWGRKNVKNYDLKDVKGSDQFKVVEAIKNGEDVTKYGVKIEYQNNSIDQIANLINELKNNPDSRRLMVSAWNVGELDKMVLPPCHYGFQVYTRELSWEERVEIARKTLSKETFSEYENLSPFTTKIIHPYWLNQHNIPKRAISLMWNQRSVDTFLGLPFNIASYGLLLMMIANEVNMIPDELIGNLGDVHLYLNHIEQAREQIGREPFELPSVHIRDGIESFMPGDIILENYQSHPAIKAPLSN
jgi:thymidylate synthase